MSNTPKHTQAAGLNLETFDAPQRALWSELGSTPEQFTLYGGTALALQLGHRKSIDFDFFSATPFDPQALLATVPYLAAARVTQLTAGNLNVVVDRGGDVKVSYFAPPRPLASIGTPVTCHNPRLAIASKIDIAACKMAVLAMRPAAKDYIDIHALLTKAKIPLESQLAAIPFVFAGQPYNPYIPLKALAYFGDGDLPSLPESVKAGLARAVAAVDIADVNRRIELAKQDPGIWKRIE
jgi:hypothetical protein